MAGLLFETLHMLGKLDLVLGELTDVLVTPLDVCTATPQPSIVLVELLLNDEVPLPQAANQSLVVIDEELDVLPVLVNLLFKMITLKWSLC